MDVHSPHEPIRSVSDFFLHLLTITIGLLIALGLEGLVEAAHNRHLVHQAEANLHAELNTNRSTLTKDNLWLTESAAEIAANMQVLTALKNHQPPSGSLDFNWHWNGTQSSAWDTARDTGAVALMPYETVQGYAIVYGQQAVVNQQALVYIHDLYRSGVSAQGRKISDLRPADIDKMIANSQEALVDLDYLRSLCTSLDTIYKSAGNEL
jgi:hypothetical protein